MPERVKDSVPHLLERLAFFHDWGTRILCLCTATQTRLPESNPVPMPCSVSWTPPCESSFCTFQIQHTFSPPPKPSPQHATPLWRTQPNAVSGEAKLLGSGHFAVLLGRVCHESSHHSLLVRRVEVANGHDHDGVRVGEVTGSPQAQESDDEGDTRHESEQD